MVPKSINIETIQYTIPTYYITHTVPSLITLSLTKRKGEIVTRCVITKNCNKKIDNHVNDLEQ